MRPPLDFTSLIAFEALRGVDLVDGSINVPSISKNKKLFSIYVSVFSAVLFYNLMLTQKCDDQEIE